MCRKRISCCNVHCHRICNKYFTTLLLLRTILNGLAASHRRPKRLHYKRWKFETLTLFVCLHDIHCGQCDLIFRNFTILGKILSLWKNYRMVYFVFSTLLYLLWHFYATGHIVVVIMAKDWIIIQPSGHTDSGQNHFYRSKVSFRSIKMPLTSVTFCLSLLTHLLTFESSWLDIGTEEG